MSPPVPIHPVIVHFPIVLVILWPIVDAAGVVSGRRDVAVVGIALLAAAVAASIAATVTGQSAFEAAVALNVDPDLLNSHADDANLVPWMLLAIFIVRSVGVLKFGKRAHALSIALGISMWVMIYAVGASGGALVYGHRVGVGGAVEPGARPTGSARSVLP